MYIGIQLYLLISPIPLQPSYTSAMILTISPYSDMSNIYIQEETGYREKIHTVSVAAGNTLE